MFWKNFSDLCKEAGKSPNSVAQELKIASGTITNWKKGKTPRNTYLKLISEYFNVSVDFLLGYIEKKEKPSDEPKAAVIPFNENEEKLLECFRACDLEGQIKILNTAIEQRDAREKIARSKTTTNA